MGKKILLADDSITIQKLVEMAFSDTDFDLVAVSDGKQAVEKDDEYNPVVILADAIMPLLDGYQVCEWVKSQPEHAHIPVVLLTGRFQPFDQTRAEAVQIDERVVKPFVQEQLVELLQRLVSQTPSVEARDTTDEVEIAEPVQVSPKEPQAGEVKTPVEEDVVTLEEEVPEDIDDAEDTLFLDEEIDDEEEAEVTPEEATRADMEKMDFDNETIRVNPDELKAYLHDMSAPGAPEIPDSEEAAEASVDEDVEEPEFDDSFNRSIESLELDEFEELRSDKIPNEEEEAGVLQLEEAELLDDDDSEPVSVEVAEDEVDQEDTLSDNAEEESIDEIETVSMAEEEKEDVKPDPDEDLTAPFPKIDVSSNVVFERQDVPDETENGDLEELDDLEFEEESFTEEPITEPSEDDTQPEVDQPAELDIGLSSEDDDDAIEELDEADLITEPTEVEESVGPPVEVEADEAELIEEMDDADLITEDEEMTQEQEGEVVSSELGIETEEAAEDLSLDEDLLLGTSLEEEEEAQELDLSDPALLDVEDSAPFELSEDDVIEEPAIPSDVSDDEVFEAPVPAETDEPHEAASVDTSPEEALTPPSESEAPTEDLDELTVPEDFELASEPEPEPAQTEELEMEEVEFDVQSDSETPEEGPVQAAEEPPEPIEVSPEPMERFVVEREEVKAAEDIVEFEEDEIEIGAGVASPDAHDAVPVAQKPEEQPDVASDETKPPPESEEMPASASFAEGASEPAKGHVVLAPDQLDYLVDQVVARVMDKLGNTVGNIAWEVIPELSEAMIKKRIFELEQQAESES